MSTKTTAYANASLDTAYGAGTAGGFYLAALTAVADGAAGTVTEAAGGAYARQLLNLAAAAGRVKANAADVTFPVSTSDHGNVVAWGVYDASVGGTLRHVLMLAAPASYNTGDQLVLLAGDLKITEGAWA